MAVIKVAWMMVLVAGCGSPAFVGGFDEEEDGGVDAAPDIAPDAAPEAEVPEPPCCVDADCPESIPFCSPWGTCYQGGDPYNCDYDSFCESFCVHCSGGTAGACDEKRCACS